MKNKRVDIKMTSRRAKRFNMPEMVRLFEDMSINTTATHYELIYEDWLELSAMWGGVKPEAKKPCTTCRA